MLRPSTKRPLRPHEIGDLRQALAVYQALAAQVQ